MNRVPTKKRMTRDELISKLKDIEWDDFEVKEAATELPKNIWEMVSAFSNASGGWIVLGVKQKILIVQIHIPYIKEVPLSVLCTKPEFVQTIIIGINYIEK